MLYYLIYELSPFFFYLNKFTYLLPTYRSINIYMYIRIKYTQCVPGRSNRPTSYESTPRVMQKPPSNEGGSNLIIFQVMGD